MIAAKFSSLFSLNFAFFSSFKPLNWDFPPCKWSSVYFKGAHWLEGKFDWCYKSLTWTPRNVDGSSCTIRRLESWNTCMLIFYALLSQWTPLSDTGARKALTNTQLYLKRASITQISSPRTFLYTDFILEYNLPVAFFERTVRAYPFILWFNRNGESQRSRWLPKHRNRLHPSWSWLFGRQRLLQEPRLSR